VSELQGIARFKFHEGKVEEFKRLSAQAMEIVRTKDTGTLQYDIYFNDDQSECIVLERYRDSEALIEHAAHLGDLTEAILATGSVSGELLGEPSAELRAKISEPGTRSFQLAAQFAVTLASVVRHVSVILSVTSAVGRFRLTTASSAGKVGLDAAKFATSSRSRRRIGTISCATLLRTT